MVSLSILTERSKNGYRLRRSVLLGSLLEERSVSDFHSFQRKILTSPARLKVICAGRQSGKTFSALSQLLIWFSQGYRILWISPTNQQTYENFRLIKRLCDDMLSYCPEYNSNMTYKTISYPLGRIRFASGANKDSLRGDYYDKIIIDEAAFVDEYLYTNVLTPMVLASPNPTRLLISTPKGFNYFYTLYQRCLKDTDRKASLALTFTSKDNPSVDDEDIIELIAGLTRSQISQEIEAKFTEGSGSVFTGVTSCIITEDEIPKPYKDTEFFFGIDWGQSIDYTVCIIVMEQDGIIYVVDMYRSSRNRFIEQVNEICDLLIKMASNRGVSLKVMVLLLTLNLCGNK